MSVDILAIGERNQKKNPQTTVLPAWQKKQQLQGTQIEAPGQRAKNTLDRQVEIGLGSRVGNLLSKKEKQIYADGLSERNWNLMQRYKAEGYSFEASKALVENQKKLKDPYASGTNKYDNYEMKENYYNRNGVQIDPESNIGKLATFMQKVGFNDTYGNPLNQLAQQYNEWYAAERDAMDYLIENEELNLLQRFGWWLEKGLLTAESGIIGGLGKIGNAVQGVEDIKSSAIDATLDRAIKGLDTDLDYYRQEDRRLDEYLWEGASGGLNTIFWAWAPKMMTAFSYIGETKAGGTALEFADNLVRGAIERGLDNGLGFYYNSLDEQGKEDMLDTMTTLAYMEIAKKTNKRTGKLKTTKVGIEYESLKNQFRKALNEGWKGAKEQAGREVSNVKNATDLYGENGTKIGKMGPEGQVGVGDSISRVVQAGVNNFKQSFIDRLNARHGGTIAEPGTVETPTAGTGKPTDTPTTDKGVVEKTKDLATQTWDTVITGLTPEERIRIQNDPYTIEKWNKARQMIEEAGMPLEDSFITEQLYNEIGENIKAVFEEWENKLGDTSPYYGEIRKNPNRYNLIESMPKVYNLLAENDIVRDPISGELDFSNSKFVTDSDMRSVQRAMNMIEKALMVPSTPREFLNLRDKLKQLASYTTVDASRGQALIRQLRHAVNEVAHKQIPGLKDLDKVTHKYFNEIEELKEGWVYKGGDRKGELRNNFYSIIKNLTGQNRKVMLDRLEKYYPGIEEEIEAIHIVNKIVKAYNKSPQMLKGLGLGGALGGATIGGGLVGALVGAIMGEMINKGVIEPLTKSKRRTAIDKLLNKMSPEAQRKLQAIAVKQLAAKELSKEDQAILDKVAEIIRQEREKGLSNQALKSWAGYTMEKNGSKWDIKPYGDYLYEITYDITEQPLEKFNGTLTSEQKKLGLDTYKIASQELDGDIDSDKEIIAARGKFMLMNQKPGYTKALGLDQGEVNQKIVSRWKDNQGPKPELVKFMEEVWEDELPENRYTGIAANFTKDNPYQNRGIDAIDFLAGDVKTAEDPTKVNYNPRIDDTIEALLFANSHLNHGADKIRFTNGVSENRYSELLRNDEANGEFFSDSLLLIGGQGDNTMKHELGHEGDAVFGIEIFGADWLRSKGVSEFYATSPKARRFLEKYGNLEKDSPYKSKEVVEFHKRLLNFVDSLKPTDWMLKDKTIIDGNPASEYWSMPQEKLARFWAQAIQEIKRMNAMGVGPRKTFRGLIGTRLGDEYTSDQLKEFLKLLQMHQNLAAKGMFYDVEPISKSDINLKTGLREYAPQKRMTKAEKKKEAMKKLSEIFDNTTILDKKNELVLKNYDPDMQKWVENTQFPEGLLVDRYETLRNAFEDKKIREGLKIASEAEDFSETAKIVKEFIEKPELKREEPNGEYIRPIRQWFNNHPGITLDSMEYSYSEDPLTWKEKLTSNRRDKVSVQDLKELGGLLKELTQKGTPEFTDDSSGLETFTESRVGGGKLNHLVESVLGGGHETFVENRLKTVGQDTWVNVIDPMLGIVGDAIEGFYDNGDNFMKSADKREEFYSIVLERLGETYRGNVKEWAEEINKNLGYIADDFEYKLKRKNIIPESKLQNLQAKVREIEPILEKGWRSLESLGTSGEAQMDMRYFLEGFQKREKETATEATEKVKQLVALSNMDVSNFEKQIKKFGGKSPMPSIAVTDVNVPHTAFGDLTLVFGRETVDPQVDPRNKIYASDAWTTTFPSLEKAGGITRELVNRETPKMVERAKENGIVLTDEETKELWQRIGSELLDSSWGEGFYTGWEDMGEMIVDKAIEKAGLDWDQWRENPDAYIRLTSDVASLIRDNQRRDIIPAWYFKGQVRYDDHNAVREVVDKIYDNLPEKGIQKLKDDGWNFDESDQKYVINQRYKDTPPKQGIQRDIDDIIERIDDYPNLTPTEAGKELVTLLTEEYGFEKKMAIEIAESIFGEIAKERLTHTGFAEKILEHVPLNDGNMGWNEAIQDDLIMDDLYLEDMLTDVKSEAEELAKTLLTKWVDNELTDELIDKLIENRRENTYNDIENYVWSDLRKKDGVDPLDDKAVEKWDFDMKNSDRVDEIMSGVGASLEDMTLYVRDVINNELLVEAIDRSRPVTPENILEAMKNQGGPRRTNDKGTLRDLVGVEGKEFTDIEQVRNKNLAKTTHDDRTGDLDDIERRYDVIIDEIKKIIKDNGNFVEPSGDSIRENIANSYDADIDKFREKLTDERAAYYEVPDDYLQAIIDAVELGKQVPVRFSEAKPERLVDLYKEVEYILVPKNDFQKVNDIVRGTPLEGKVHMYDRDGFKDARSQRMKNLQARYGNIFFGMGGIVMPIAMLLMMVQQEETA